MTVRLTETPLPIEPSLAVELAGIRFPNPIFAAPGPLGFGREVQNVVDLRSFGAFITKSVTVEARSGNPYPQLAQTDAGWMNSLGLPNHGLAAFLTRDLPFLRTLGIPIIVSVAGESLDEFTTLVEWVGQEAGVAAIELNLSCPNVHAGLTFAVDPRLTFELVTTVRPRSPLPLIAKLSPNITDIVPIARAAEEAGANALSLINTLTALSIDVETRRPRLGAVTGGLSGPAIRPVAVRMVWEVSRACAIPIIGMGGVASGLHAAEFLIAGAGAVAVGAAVIERPAIASEICNELSAYLRRHEMPSITALVGTLQTS